MDLAVLHLLHWAEIEISIWSLYKKNAYYCRFLGHPVCLINLVSELYLVYIILQNLQKALLQFFFSIRLLYIYIYISAKTVNWNFVISDVAIKYCSTVSCFATVLSHLDDLTWFGWSFTWFGWSFSSFRNFYYIILIQVIMNMVVVWT